MVKLKPRSRTTYRLYTLKGRKELREDERFFKKHAPKGSLSVAYFNKDFKEFDRVGVYKLPMIRVKQGEKNIDRLYTRGGFVDHVRKMELKKRKR